jgi:hypothetical protein
VFNLSLRSIASCQDFLVASYGFARGVGNSNHILVPLSPCLFLFVLANLDQDPVLSLLELDRLDVLVDLRRGVVHFVGHDELSVDPYLVTIDAPKANLRGSFYRRIELRCRVYDTSFFIGKNFCEIHVAVFLFRGVFRPGHATIFAFVAFLNSVSNPVFFNRKLFVKVLDPDVIERADEIPILDESEMCR